MNLPKFNTLSGSVPWNLFLITSGTTLYTIGAMGLASPQDFIAGGLFGTGMLIYYATKTFSVAIWFFLLNIPLLFLGMKFLSRRFLWYSTYGILASTVATELITFRYMFEDPILAAVAAGAVCGAGIGLVLRSLGSDGGLTIVAIILHQKFNLRMGQVFFFYNVLLFLAGIAVLDIAKVMYSLIFILITSVVMDNMASMFNQRKMALIVTEKHMEISESIMKRLRRGATLIPTRGAFTQKERYMLMTVIQNYQLKRLEELIFEHDENAFLIVENTFNVMGTGFSKRKIY